MKNQNKKINLLENFFPHKHAIALMAMIIGAVGIFGYFGVYKFSSFIDLKKVDNISQYLKADVTGSFQRLGVEVTFGEPLDVLETGSPFPTNTKEAPYLAMPIYIKGTPTENLSTLKIGLGATPTYLSQVMVEGGQYLDPLTYEIPQNLAFSSIYFIDLGLSIPAGTSFAEATAIGVMYFKISSLSLITSDLDFVISSLRVNSYSITTFKPDNVINIIFEPPASPENLVADPIGSTSFVLSWDAGTGAGSVDGYNVYLDQVFKDTTTELTYTYYNLNSPETYDASVVAYNMAGSSDMAKIEVTTRELFKISSIDLVGEGIGGNSFYAVDERTITAKVNSNRPGDKYTFIWACNSGNCPTPNEILHTGLTVPTDVLRLENAWEDSQWELKVEAGAVIDDKDFAAVDFSLVNKPPVANDDNYTTDEDSVLDVNGELDGLLKNDEDDDGDELYAKLEDDSRLHGQLELKEDGSFIYKPDDDYNGTDTFTYRAFDGDDYSDIATVTIDVKPVNDAPVTTSLSKTTLEDTFFTDTLPATDIDTGSVLTRSIVANPTHGTVVITNATTGAFKYTPASNYNGTDSFTFKANDGTVDSNISTVSITITPVNDAPVAVADTYSVNEDSSASIAQAAGVLKNDMDPDGNALTAVLDTNVSHGTLTLNSNGSFTYIPTGNYNGSDSFTYHANDGTVDSNIVTVTITVTPENDIPMISDIPDQTIDQGQSFAMVNLDEFVSDVDNADDTLVWTYTGNTNLILTITNRVLVITASANWSGSERIYFTVTDPDGLYDQDDATFTVNPAGNTPPVISVIPDKQIEINTVAGPLTFAIGDIEDDSTALVLSKTSSNTALVPINNIVFGGSGANRTVTVTPLNNQSGATNINITVTDTAGASDNEEFVLTVNPVGNTPPVAVDDVYSVQENGVLNVSAPGRLVNDTDADGDTLIAVDYTTPSSGSLIHSEDGSFIYTPQAGVTGFVSFQYKANDGTVSSNPAIVKIYITDGGQTRGDCNVDTQVDLADVLLALQVVAGTKPLSDINIPNCNLVLVDPNVPIDMLDVLAVYDLV